MNADPAGSAVASNNATGAAGQTAGTGAQPTPQQQEQRFGKRGSGQAFALGLFQILTTEDPKVIGWSSSGKAFRIGDSEKFCKEIMPRFFKQNKYSSFQRQLNLYGFRKLVRGNEAGGYMHPLFERGKPGQLNQVRRGHFPEIPPEFAHDVHGHGLNDGVVGAAGDAGASGSSKTAARRKSEASRANGSVGGKGAGAGGGHERSSSLGQSGLLAGMTPAAAAAAAVTAAAAPGGGGGRGSGGGHNRTGSGPLLRGHRGDGMSVEKQEWDSGGRGPLPSLDSVTGGLRNLHGGRHGSGGGQSGGTEMPPTLGRLVPCAENVVSRESSPMKSGSGGGGSGGGRMQTPSSADFQHNNHHPPYGRSQDDLSLTPRSHYANPIMGMGGNWATGGVHGGPGGGFPHGRSGGGGGHPGEFFASNSSGGNGGLNTHHHDRSPRPLQHMHSRDDLDALRPRKTRRTGPSFDGDDQHNSDQGRSSRHGFLAVSPRANRNGSAGGAEGGFMGECGGYLNTAGVYAGPDEVPPAAPRRLVSRHNTPSRPERSGSKNNGNGGGDGDDAGRRGGGGGGHLMNLDPSAMDTDGGGGGQGFQLAAHGFYAAMSPVVPPGRTAPGFGGGRRGHHRHSSSGTQQSSSGDLGAGGGSQWRVGEVSPDEPAVLQGDSPSSSRSGGGSSTSGGGIPGAGGLGLTAHAISRMEQVKAPQRANGMVNGMQAPGSGGGPQGVQQLGENLSQLDLSEHSRNEMYRQQRAGGGGGGDGSDRRSQQQQQQQHQQQHQQQQHQHQHHQQQQSHQHQHQHQRKHHQHQHQRRQPAYTQPLRDSGGSSWGMGQGHNRQGSAGSGGMPGERRPTAAEAAELLRRRSSVDEVIGLLSGPAADGSFEDEASRQQYDPAQFDSWRNSLTKVLGHLGFDIEDEQGVPLQQETGPDGKRSPIGKNAPSRGNSQFLSWGGTSAMSFEERPEEFHESLRQIPMRWRSSLSCIMTSMASGGGLDEHGAPTGGGVGGSGGTVGMNSGGGGGAGGSGGGGERKLEQQASLEMLQSVMRETLESMSSGVGGGGGGQESRSGSGNGTEEEAKAAAEAALAMGSMCRAKSNDQLNGVGSGGNGNHANGNNSRPLSIGSTTSSNGRPLSTGNGSGSGRAGGRGNNAYNTGGQYGGGGGGGVGIHHEHQTTF